MNECYTPKVAPGSSPTPAAPLGGTGLVTIDSKMTTQILDEVESYIDTLEEENARLRGVLGFIVKEDSIDVIRALARRALEGNDS